jgi:hypothetical protein
MTARLRYDHKQRGTDGLMPKITRSKAASLPFEYSNLVEGVKPVGDHLPAPTPSIVLCCLPLLVAEVRPLSREKMALLI